MANEMPYEEMTDAQLEELTEQVIEEHTSGIAPLRPRDDAETARVTGTVPISLRIPEWLLDSIKGAAEKQKEPYQRLMKRWLEEGLERDEPQSVPKPVRLRLTPEQLARLRQSGLDIHLEAS